MAQENLPKTISNRRSFSGTFPVRSGRASFWFEVHHSWQLMRDIALFFGDRVGLRPQKCIREVYGSVSVGKSSPQNPPCQSNKIAGQLLSTLLLTNRRAFLDCFVVMACDFGQNPVDLSKRYSPFSFQCRPHQPTALKSSLATSRSARKGS